MSDPIVKGGRAKHILESPEWIEAWAKYEATLLQDFRDCKSDDISRLQQLKMLHLAGVAARSHLESLVANGNFAAKNLEFQAKPPFINRVLNAIK
jgi:hypothetical protein